MKLLGSLIWGAIAWVLQKILLINFGRKIERQKQTVENAKALEEYEKIDAAPRRKLGDVLKRVRRRS